MAENRNTARLVEVGLNKYGQRLDEYNEFGQSLEAEVWHFDALADVSVAPLPPLERLIRPVREKELVITEDTNIAKPAGAGVNKYGQRLDEYNEFGLSLEAEAWHFDALAEVSVAPLPPLERLVRPARKKNRSAAGTGTSPAETHRRAA